MPPKISSAAIEASTAVSPITELSAEVTVDGHDKGVKRPLTTPNVVPPAKKMVRSNEATSPPPSGNDRLVAFESPSKKMVRNVVNISIERWKELCPEGSPSAFSGIGTTYCIIIEQQPSKMVVTKNDQRRVSKKSIIIGDDTGHEAELVIWGPLAARSWT
jgi:hypothetical protein